MRNTPSKNLPVFWIVFGFIVWIIIFFGFLCSRLSIVEDATSYYEHTKFFIENLARGVFPLWDPFWFNGAPNDFFLLRIGAFNPFYFVILIFEFFKIPYTLAYFSFLALYYWGGMIAFYLLAMRIYDNRLMAYAGYLILLFSSLGTRLFDSYMMLVTVPLIWFFYFLVAFTQAPRKYLFLGLSLSFMILSSTYIPLYFLSFFFLFVFLFILFYFKRISEILSSYAVFFKKNKLLVFLSLGIVLLSFVPSITFFQNSSHGQIVLPARHGGVEAGQALVVSSSTLDWGAAEDLLYSFYFSDFRTIRFAVVYIPFFAFIVFSLGLLGRLTRRAVFMFTCGFVLFCCIIPHGLPFYKFLYKHLFFLKYFRNLHFFLWFVLIPLFVLLILEHWRIFTEVQIKGWLTKKKILFFVLLIHSLFFLFVLLKGDAVLSSYITILLSSIFWFLMIQGKLINQAWAFGILAITILVQPLEVYHYLSLKAKSYQGGYGYALSFTSLSLQKPPLPPQETFPKTRGSGLYYASGSYNDINQSIAPYALALYLQNPLILVDHLQSVDRKEFDSSVLEKYFLNNENKAFVFKEDLSDLKINSNDPQAPSKAWRVSSEKEGVKVLSFNANHLKLSLDLPYEKFLIYNDSYDPHWQVNINGKPVHLYQTNIAFKGVWVPKGKSVVEFHYGFWWQYVMNGFLLFAGLAFSFGIVWFFRRDL